jgi:hypothetical protein
MQPIAKAFGGFGSSVLSLAVYPKLIQPQWYCKSPGTVTVSCGVKSLRLRWAIR